MQEKSFLHELRAYLIYVKVGEKKNISSQLLNAANLYLGAIWLFILFPKDISDCVRINCSKRLESYATSGRLKTAKKTSNFSSSVGISKIITYKFE